MSPSSLASKDHIGDRLNEVRAKLNNTPFPADSPSSPARKHRALAETWCAEVRMSSSHRRPWQSSLRTGSRGARKPDDVITAVRVWSADKIRSRPFIFRFRSRLAALSQTCSCSWWRRWERSGCTQPMAPEVRTTLPHPPMRWAQMNRRRFLGCGIGDNEEKRKCTDSARELGPMTVKHQTAWTRSFHAGGSSQRPPTQGKDPFTSYQRWGPWRAWTPPLVH